MGAHSRPRESADRVRARDERGRRNERLATQRAQRRVEDARRAAEQAKVAAARATYQLEKARRLEQGKRVLRTIDEYRELVPIYYGEPTW